MKELTQWCAFLLILLFVIAGLPALQAIAQTPGIARTADDFTNMLGGGPPADGFKSRETGRTRGMGEIVQDPTSNFEQPAPSADYYAVASQSYKTLANNQLTAAAQVQFDTNSSRIDSGGYRVLNELAKALQSKLADAVLVVAGHTDSQGPSAYNLWLSNERAQAVRDFLVSRGVDARRLIAKGYGEDYPIRPNETKAGRTFNRRSEFIRIGSL